MVRDLWQPMGMGNKDARRREVKKPKKKKPTRADVHQIPARFVREAPPAKPTAST
jgi:hypothetical protein